MWDELSLLATWCSSQKLIKLSQFQRMYCGNKRAKIKKQCIYSPKLETDAEVGEASTRTKSRTKKLENKLMSTGTQFSRVIKLYTMEFRQTIIHSSWCAHRTFYPVVQVDIRSQSLCLKDNRCSWVTIFHSAVCETRTRDLSITSKTL